MERLSEREKGRIAELVAVRAPAWMIRREVNRSRWAIRRYVNKWQRPPTPKPTRSPLRLWLSEREEIARGLARGESLRGIARRLGRVPSTVCREVQVNGGAGRYRACRPDRAALRRARRPKRSQLAEWARLWAVVEANLELRWSPQQISGWLVCGFPDDPELRVSHETIYPSWFVQSRGALRKELSRFLRRGPATRRPLGHSVMSGQGQLRGTIHISPGRRKPTTARSRDTGKATSSSAST